MIQSKTDKTINIGLYFHSPFPSSEVYRVLAHREQILNAILTCDLIGFHLFEYARHFITSCKRLLGIDHLVTRGGDLALSYLGR